MIFAVGDRVTAETESTERTPRTGTIQEVLRTSPMPRYRIEWDDGRTTIYAPAAGALSPARERTPSFS
jgi:hypothetical protein